jgi:formylglycine-generating enzyme required for sulfatase activity
MKYIFFLMLILISCTSKFDTEQVDTEQVDTEQVDTEQVDTDSSNIFEVIDNSKVISSCKDGMIEIKGSYCSRLLHKCISGGKNNKFKKTEEPLPYYCDEYKKEYAKCVGTEKLKNFCIDKYEYPNVVGVIPMVMVSWYKAKELCEAKGKRLCGDDEWTLACEGPDRLPYTYGWKRDAGACNIDHLWIAPNNGKLESKNPKVYGPEVDRLSKRVPAGSMPGCKSPYGVMDMGGNVDEWTLNVTHHAKPYKSIFKGGHWAKGARNRCRPITSSHNENTAYYAEGFRCCSDNK